MVKYHCLVVNGKKLDYDFPIILGMSSSQLTNYIFQRGRSTTTSFRDAHVDHDEPMDAMGSHHSCSQTASFSVEVFQNFLPVIFQHFSAAPHFCCSNFIIFVATRWFFKCSFPCRRWGSPQHECPMVNSQFANLKMVIYSEFSHWSHGDFP